VQPVVDRVQVGLADVLGRVDPEAGDAVADQLVEVRRQPVAHRALPGVEVGQTHQLAAEHLLGVVEVLAASAVPSVTFVVTPFTRRQVEATPMGRSRAAQSVSSSKSA
jgi:hypothetical protein